METYSFSAFLQRNHDATPGQLYQRTEDELQRVKRGMQPDEAGGPTRGENAALEYLDRLRGLLFWMRSRVPREDHLADWPAYRQLALRWIDDGHASQGLLAMLEGDARPRGS